MNLYEVGRWKSQIAKILSNDENIVSVVLPSPDDDMDIIDQMLGVDGVGGRVFEHEFVPETQEETKSFICIEAAMSGKNPSTAMYYLTVWCFCHKSILDTYHRKGCAGTRMDILSADIDRALNGTSALENQIGKLELVASDPYKPQKDYYGRVLIYAAPSFGRRME